MLNQDQAQFIIDTSENGVMVYKSIRDEQNQIFDFECVFANSKSLVIAGMPIEQLLSTSLRKRLTDSSMWLFDSYVKVVELGEVFKMEFPYYSEGVGNLYFNTVTKKLEDGFYSIFSDTTEQRKFQDIIVANEKKYRNIFENVQDVFYQTDPNGIITEISPSIKQYSEYDREEIIGRPVTDFYYFTEDREKLATELFTKGIVNNFEVRLKTKDDRLVFTSVNCHLVKDEEGNVIGAEGSMRDISEQKSQREKIHELFRDLQEINRQKDKLFSIIAHDLRGPLGAFANMFDLLVEDYDSFTREELMECFTHIKASSSNVFQLLEDLLLWASNQLDKVAFEPRMIRLDQIVAKVFNYLQPQSAVKNIHLDHNIPAEIEVFADSNMVETVIRNLISNAIKFSYPGKKVTLSIEQQGDFTNLLVMDEGKGIPADDLNKLFDKTSVYTTYGTQGEKGTGIGLDLCWDFVERNGGKMEVQSEVGKGSTFSFSLKSSPTSRLR